MHLAAKNNALHILSSHRLKRYGININVKDKKGRTPLHLAVENCKTSAVGSLTEHNVDFNIKDKNGLTPEDLAKNKGYYYIARLLNEANVANNNSKGSSKSFVGRINKERRGRHDGVCTRI